MFRLTNYAIAQPKAEDQDVPPNEIIISKARASWNTFNTTNKNNFSWFSREENFLDFLNQ